MSHIYIHIPFCSAKCAYCDFYSIPAIKKQDCYTESLLQEISLRKNDVENIVSTIYFGGGTPSLLSQKNIAKILNFIKNNFNISEKAEITLEANPENINPENCNFWQQLGINRLSIGIQSFNDNDLRYLHRRHSGKAAYEAIIDAQKSGFTNISVDFIHGIPNSDNLSIIDNIRKIAELQIPHVSMYSLTIEEGTILDKLIEKGKTENIDDDKQYEQMQIAIDAIEKFGYIHYEISNFCLPGYEAVHNTSYWVGEKYTGFGPSAHSFDGKTRRWNTSNIDKYISAINNNEIYSEYEIIGKKEAYNEFLLTRLRMKNGFSKEEFTNLFGDEKLIFLLSMISKSDNWHIIGNRISLSDKGFFFADKIISDLMEI